MRIFVYGTLKNGYSNNYLMEGYEEYKECYVEGFRLYSNGFFPCAITGDEQDIIYGEIYSYKENEKNILNRLDTLEGYYDSDRDLYKRIKTTAKTLDSNYECFMYLYNKNVFNLKRLENFF